MSATITIAEPKTYHKTDEQIVSFNPATNEIVGRVANNDRAAVFAAVENARFAQKDWRKLNFNERAKFVLTAREILLDEMESVAKLISAEMGKPVAEAIAMEIAPVLDLMQYFARNTAKLLKPEAVDVGLVKWFGRASKIVYQPIGVVGIISPWNYPLAIPLGETVMALMAGNAVVLKPSELTPLVGLKIGEIFKDLPANVLQVVTGDGRTGAALVEADVSKIMFTGSVETGKRIAAAAAKNLTPVVLELGGKDPMIVLQDANLEVAANAAVWGAFANSGQTCASVERLYVHESIAQKFTEKIVELTKNLRQNQPDADDCEIGAMSSERQLQTVENHVEDAINNGARILTGGKRNQNFDGAFYEPTVLTDVDHSFKAVREETFGPTLPIMTFTTDAEAIELANDSDFGLTASVWTRDIKRGRKIAHQIEAGTVTVNEVLYTHGIAQTPWGGVKKSGYGRTHGRLGLLELVTPQHIHINRLTFVSSLWWFDYSGDAAKLFRGFAKHFATGSLFHTTKLLPQMLKRLRHRKG